MSWISTLYQTYDSCQNQDGLSPWPVSHAIKNAHLEVVIDDQGNFISGRAQLLDGENAATLIPVTEASGGRTGSKVAPHPLCEEMSYCAGDLPKLKSAKFEAYCKQLSDWCSSEYTHGKAEAILTYIKKKTVWLDISQEIDFPIKFRSKSGQSQKILPDKTFIRWRVEEPGVPNSATWTDENLIQSWIQFDAANNSTNGFCNVLGEVTRVASNHPRFIRNPGDGGKLISSNDSSGYTFKGRFLDSNQACLVGFEVTQKAHNALRWLIAKQGYRFDDQVFVSWAVSGEEIPDPMADTHRMMGMVAEEIEDIGDVGQAFAKRLSKHIAGYQATISDTAHIVVMGLDSATPGRMAITYYRDLERSEFLQRLEHWHQQFAWYQNYSKDIKFVGAPAPKDIAEAAYGRRLEDKLKKATVERLLPCIIDQFRFPNDLVFSTIRRASNRVGMEKWEWEKVLGIACSLYRGSHQQENYAMSLEEDRTTRDYLYGRLLAVADYIEEISLSDSEKNRQTNAARFMQRFASRPYQTWPMLYEQLAPYIARIKANRTGRWKQMMQLLEDIKDKFTADSFTDPSPLSGEFLLAYYSQRKALWKAKEKTTETTTEPAA